MQMSGETTSADSILRMAGFEQPQRDDLLRCWGESFVGLPFSGFTPEQIHQRKQELVMTSLKVMNDLMAEGPEVLHGVYKTFGIRQFGRYQASTLLEQLKNYQSSNPALEQSTTLVVTATDDWSGSLHDTEESFGMLKPVYMEASSIGEMARAVVKTRKHFGPINNLVIHGHGSKHRLELSKASPITSETACASLGLARIEEKGILAPGARLVLAACHTGEEGGLAEMISAVSGQAVIGARKGTIPHIEPDKENPDRKVIKFPNVENTANIIAKWMKDEGIDEVELPPELRYKEDDTVVVYIGGKATSEVAYLAA